MPVTLEEGIRLYKQGKVHAASSLFEQVASSARTHGDRILEGRALGNLGTCCARRGEHEEAIKLYRQALSLLGDDRQRAVPLLQYLERSYAATQDMEGQQEVAARLAQLAFEEQEEEACFGDAEAGEVGKAKKRPQKMLSSLMGYLAGSIGMTINRLDVREDMLRMKALAGQQDANDEHVLHHLSQVRFADIPFASISRKLQASQQVDAAAEKIPQLLSDVNYHVGSACQELVVAEALGNEPRGTLRHALEAVERHVQRIYVHAKAAQQVVIQEGLQPMEEMRRRFSAVADGREQALRAAEKSVEGLEEEQRKLLERLASRQERWAEAVRMLSVDGRARSNSADEETVEVLQEEVAEVKKAVGVLNERIEEAEQIRVRVREEVCRDLELLEQRRIDVVKQSMQAALKAQVEALKMQQKELEEALQEMDKVDRASDLRSFANHELIKQSCQDKRGEEEETGPEEQGDNEEIATAVQKLFEGEENVDLSNLCKLFEDEKNRASALRCLNRHRSKRTNVGDSFDALTVVFIGLLDHAYIKADVKCAKMILILAETFYHVEAEQKVYIQERIKGHAMWKAVAFWEEVFYQSVQEEIRRNWAVRADGERGLPMSTFKNLVYGQIGSCAFSMISCEVEPKLVRLFIDRMCIANGMHEQQRRDLMSSVKSEEHSSS